MSDTEILLKVLKKQETIGSDITDIKIIQGRQEEILKNHIYRTELAESNIELLRDQVKPLETKMNFIQGALKLIGIISLMSTIALAVLNFLKFLPL